MDDADFERLWFGPEGRSKAADHAKDMARQIRDQRNYWLELLPRLASGEQPWNEEVLVRMLHQSQLACETSFFAMQWIYYEQTGRNLDNTEIDDFGASDAGASGGSPPTE